MATPEYNVQDFKKLYAVNMTEPDLVAINNASPNDVFEQALKELEESVARNLGKVFYNA
jgi:hypothetical protein